jgi:hypothetical protein
VPNTWRTSRRSRGRAAQTVLGLLNNMNTRFRSVRLAYFRGDSRRGGALRYIVAIASTAYLVFAVIWMFVVNQDIHSTSSVTSNPTIGKTVVVHFRGGDRFVTASEQERMSAAWWRIWPGVLVLIALAAYTRADRRS